MINRHEGHRVLYYAKLLRIKHYVKNLLVFAPLFFCGNIFSSKILSCLFAFVNLCLMASSIYIINDIHDIEKDKLHPTKCKRPLASGKITLKNASILIVCCLVLMIILQVIEDINNVGAWIILGLYFVFNLLYSIGNLKNYELFDVFILSAGFVLRIMYGSAMTAIPISALLYLVVFFGSLFMAFGKRYNELSECGDKTRAVLNKYTLSFLKAGQISSLTLSIMFYSLWCMEKLLKNNEQGFLFTVPLFTFILLKYLLDIDIEKNEDGDPTNIILSDKMLQLLSVIMILILGYLIYR